MKNIKIAMMLVGLLALSFAAQAEQSHLDNVIQQGQLRVCTTGDYKPYTSKAEDGEYSGIDIAMARSLADSLGVKVEWVQTTWKTLMPDMLAGKCDIGMGGISVTLDRQKKPSSAPRWMSTAKSPSYAARIRRCTRRSSKSTSLRFVWSNRPVAPMKPLFTRFCPRRN